MGNVIIHSAILVCIIVLGYILKKVKLFSGSDYTVFTRLVMYLTLPAVIITGFCKFEWNNSLLLLPVLGFFINGLMLIMSMIISRKYSDEDKKFFIVNTAGLSVGTFAMPFIQNALCTEGIVAACMFDAGGTLMPSGLNYISACVSLSANKRKVGITFILKRLFTSPPFLAYIAMMLISATGFSLPGAVIDFVGQIADANAFLCMFMIGLMFEVKLQKENILKVIKVLVIRLSIATLASLMIFYLLPFDLGLKRALIVVLFSPIATLDLIFTDKIKGDIELAGFVNSLSIILSIIIMTALMAIL